MQQNLIKSLECAWNKLLSSNHVWRQKRLYLFRMATRTESGRKARYHREGQDVIVIQMGITVHTGCYSKLYTQKVTELVVWRMRESWELRDSVRSSVLEAIQKLLDTNQALCLRHTDTLRSGSCNRNVPDWILTEDPWCMSFHILTPHLFPVNYQTKAKNNGENKNK